MKHTNLFKRFISSKLFAVVFAVSVSSFFLSSNVFAALTSDFLTSAFKSYITPTSNSTFTLPKLPTVTNSPSLNDAQIISALRRLITDPYIAATLRGPAGATGAQGPAGNSGSSGSSSSGNYVTQRQFDNQVDALLRNISDIREISGSGSSSGGSSQWTTDGDDISYNDGDVHIGLATTPGSINGSSPLNVVGNNDAGTLTLVDNVANGTNSSFYNGSIRFSSAPGTDFYLGKGSEDNDTYFQLRNDSDTKLFTVDSVGNFGIGTDDPSAKLEVTGGTDWNIWSGPSQSQMDSTIQAYTPYGKNVFTSLNPSVPYSLVSAAQDNATSGDLFGVFGVAEATNASGSRGIVTAIEGDAYASGAGNTSRLQGLEGDATNDGTGTVTEANGLFSYVANAGGGTITNASGLHVYANGNSSGTITNNYGIKVEDQTAGTNNWNIWSGANYADLSSSAQDAASWGKNTFAIHNAGERDAGSFVYDGGTGNVGGFGAIEAFGQFAGTGGINNVESDLYYNGTGGGLQMNAFTGGFYNTSSGNISLASSYQTYGITNQGSGTISNAIGVDILSNVNSGAGSITNNYGIKIENQTAGDNNWAIKTGLGEISFGDNVAIGMDHPSVALDVTGDIEYTGTITDVSDRRLKENIIDAGSGLAILNNIGVKSFNMINTPNRTETGFIAQNVQQYFPEAVSIVDPEHGYLGVSYVSFIPVLTKAVQELDVKLEGLDARLAVLEAANQSTGLLDSLFSKVTAWLADAGNGITDLFAGTIHSEKSTTKLLCVNNSSGETCIDRDQLDALLENVSVAPTNDTTDQSGGVDNTGEVGDPSSAEENTPSENGNGEANSTEPDTADNSTSTPTENVDTDPSLGEENISDTTPEETPDTPSEPTSDSAGENSGETL